jgi:hypothetical protein
MEASEPRREQRPGEDDPFHDRPRGRPSGSTTQADNTSRQRFQKPATRSCGDLRVALDVSGSVRAMATARPTAVPTFQMVRGRIDEQAVFEVTVGLLGIGRGGLRLHGWRAVNDFIHRRMPSRRKNRPRAGSRSFGVCGSADQGGCPHFGPTSADGRDVSRRRSACRPGGTPAARAWARCPASPS